MSEGEITVPRLGTIAAAPTFRLVAAMNPFDAVGTARISAAVYDRLCRLAVDYQSAEEERAITQRESGATNNDLVAKAVEVVRRTRTHHDIRIGSSVRGAIDLCALVGTLADVRDGDQADPAVTLDAALFALSSRIKVREGSDRTPEHVIEEIWAEVFNPAPAPDEGDLDVDPGKATAPEGPKS